MPLPQDQPSSWAACHASHPRNRGVTPASRLGMKVFPFNPSHAWRTSMHRLMRGAVIGGILATSLLGTSLGAVAASTRSGVTGHVYVNNNTAGHNTVSGFDRHADGTLTAIAGTPFDAGGAGTAAQLGRPEHYSSPATAATCSPSMRRRTTSPSSRSARMARCAWSTRPPRTGRARSASPSTSSSYTSRIPARGAATTPGSG